MLENLGEPEDKLCQLGRKALKLSPEDFQILQNALADTRWQGATLARKLTENGFPVSKDTVNTHRKKQCACVR